MILTYLVTYLITYLLTYLLRREWSDIGEMWHAIAEWHDNYGDEVETEKQDELKTKNCSLVVLVCKSGMIFQCKNVRFRRSWTTA